MARPSVEIPASLEPSDLDMAEDSEIIDVDAPGEEGDVEFDDLHANGNGTGNEDEDEDGTEDSRPTFVDYLRSPIVELVIGTGEEETILTAHQAILEESPFLAEALSQLTENTTRRISLPDESLDAIGCFLQYQYTGEYFPRRLLPQNTLEPDSANPTIDTTGQSLLKHARVYTLAEKLSLPSLKALAHSKIHLVSSTAKGEIAYARYVYGNTPADDTTIRRPVAAFWATRSHVLRHEAELEFRQMCLEFPLFGFDVLSLVLDQRERGKGGGHGFGGGERVSVSVSETGDEPRSAGKGRKRSRFG